MSVVDDEHARFLASYIVGQTPAAIVYAFLSGNPAAVDALQPIETGLVLASHD